LPILATAVLTSANAKLTTEPELRQVSATYKATTGCGGCPLLHAGCYAERGNVGIHGRRLTRAAVASKATSYDVTAAEANAIRALPTDGRPLRLGVVGETASTREARELASAVGELRARGGGPAWGYSHHWRTIRRDSWGTISQLASCERPKEAATAHRRGYAAALVVGEWSEAQALRPLDLVARPCPEETGRGLDCHSCRLCFDAEALHARREVIVFRAREGTRRQSVATLRALNEG